MKRNCFCCLFHKDLQGYALLIKYTEIDCLSKVTVQWSQYKRDHAESFTPITELRARKGRANKDEDLQTRCRYVYGCYGDGILRCLGQPCVLESILNIEAGKAIRNVYFMTFHYMKQF